MIITAKSQRWHRVEKCTDDCSFNSKDKKKALSLLGNMEKNNTSTCWQPGFTQSLPTPAYGKHRLARTRTHVLSHYFWFRGVGIWQAAHGCLNVTSLCTTALYLHTQTWLHWHTWICNHADAKTHADTVHVHTHTHTQARGGEGATVFCLHPQTSWQLKSNIKPGIVIHSRPVCPHLNRQTAVFPLSSLFSGIKRSLIFRKSRQNYCQFTPLETEKTILRDSAHFSGISTPPLQLLALLAIVHNMKHKEYVYF